MIHIKRLQLMLLLDLALHGLAGWRPVAAAMARGYSYLRLIRIWPYAFEEQQSCGDTLLSLTGYQRLQFAANFQSTVVCPCNLSRHQFDPSKLAS